MAGQSKRGFAAMLPQKQREIARRGGQTAHQKGTAHEFTPEEARVAGRRGGKAVSSDRQYMAEIGRRGGQSSGRHTARSRQSQNEVVNEMLPKAETLLSDQLDSLAARMQQREQQLMESPQDSDEAGTLEQQVSQAS